MTLPGVRSQGRTTTAQQSRLRVPIHCWVCPRGRLSARGRSTSYFSTDGFALETRSAACSSRHSIAPAHVLQTTSRPKAYLYIHRRYTFQGAEFRRTANPLRKHRARARNADCANKSPGYVTSSAAQLRGRRRWPLHRASLHSSTEGTAAAPGEEIMKTKTSLIAHLPMHYVATDAQDFTIERGQTISGPEAQSPTDAPPGLQVNRQGANDL